MQQTHKYNSDITLEINITIGKDFKKTLTYIQGQDPVLAASLFCEQNNLKPSAVYYIQQAIEQVIHNVEEIENQSEQSYIPEGNSFDEYDQRSSEESDYQQAGSFRKPQQNYKQYSKSPIRQTNNVNSNKKTKEKNYPDLEKNHHLQHTNRNDIQNPGIRLYQKGQTQNLIKEQNIIIIITILTGDINDRKKLEQMKIYQEQQDLKEATFQPSINFTSLLLSEKQDQFERSEKMRRKKEDRMNQIRLNSLVKEQEKCTFQPQIGVVSSRIGQFTKEHREVQEIFEHLYLDSYRRQQQMDKKKQDIQSQMEEKNKLECTFTPEINSYSKSFELNLLSDRNQLELSDTKQPLISDRKQIELMDRKQLQLSQQQIDSLNKSNYTSLNSSRISLLSTREGLIIDRPKMQTPLCNYQEQISPPKTQIQPHYHKTALSQPVRHVSNLTNHNNQSQTNHNNQSQTNVSAQKNFFNLENKFQQMKQQQFSKLTSPVKFKKPEDKSTEKKLKRSNSVNVWDNLYQQAIQQKENQKEFEFKIKQQIQKEINKQKLSIKSKEIISQQRNQIIECIFEVLDGKKLGYVSPDNLCQQYLSDNLNRILKPLYEAVFLNNTILDCQQFKKAVKSLYNTIHFNDKLAISRILQNRSQSLPNHQKQNHQPKVNPFREANYVCKRCKTCQDTLQIIDQLDQIKQNYESIHQCHHSAQNN